MKQLYLSVLALVGMVTYGQEVTWQRNIKSNTQDFLSQLTTTIDGQILLSGSTIQTNQQPISSTNQNNGYDFHVLKMNQQGQTVWEKYFGGTQHDFLTATVSTQEGGFLLAGTSYSDEGLQKKNKSKGGSDIWLIRLDENGDEQWQKTLGTEVDEEAKSVIQTTDLGYYVAGNIQSKKGAFGSKDVLLVKLDKNGKIINQLYLGGKGLDEVEKIIPTKDGGALVGIYSRSSKMENGKMRTEKELSLDEESKEESQEESNLANNQPSTNNHQQTTKESNSSILIPTTYHPKTTEHYGEGDFWVVKLSKEGKVEWEKSFGGKEDDHLRTLANTDTGFIISGESRSGNSGNKKSSIKEGTDLWVIALNELGEEQWQKGFNFKNRDVLMSLNTISTLSTNNHQSTTKGYLLGGYTQTEGKVQKNDETFWMLYVDNKGEEVWRKYVEGKEKKKEERLVAATINRDGSYLLAGTSAEELGKENWKIVKLGDKQVEQLIEKQDMRIYPNPVSDYCYVEIGVEFKEATINVYDMTGKLVYQTKTKNSVTKLNTGNLPQGSYIVTANTENKSITNKIVKK